MRIAFSPNVSVSGDNFFGRKREFNEIRMRLSHEQSVLVTGQRRIGKTSLLSHAHQFLQLPDTQLSQVWIDVMGPLTTLDRVTETLLRSLKDVISAPPKSYYRPSEYEQVLDGLYELYRADKRMVLYINDIDDVIAYDNEPVTHFLRSLVDTHHTLICATTFHGLGEDSISSQLRYLFNVFHPMMLKAFSEKEAKEFLLEVSERSGEKLFENECTLLLDLFGFVPFHLQVVGFNLFSQDGFIGSLGKKRRDSFNQAINDSLDNLVEHWSYAVDLMPEEHALAMVKLAKGEKSLESASIRYLTYRGFIDTNQKTFQPMGSLFKNLLESWDLEGKGHGVDWRAAGRHASSLFRTAFEVLIESSIKAYMQ